MCVGGDGGDESGCTVVRQQPANLMRSVSLALLWLVATGIVLMASMYVYWGVNPVGVVTKLGNGVLRVIFSYLR